MKKINHKNKIPFDEYYACELLKKYFPEQCKNLKIVDRPDLQSDKFNVEVTSIHDKYQVETNALLRNKLFSNCDNTKLDDMLKKKGVILNGKEIVFAKHNFIDLQNILEKIIKEKMNKSYIHKCNAIFFINYCYSKEKSKVNINDIIKKIIKIYKNYDNPFQYIFLLYDEYNFCYYEYSSNNITYKYIPRKQLMLIHTAYFKEQTNE